MNANFDSVVQGNEVKDKWISCNVIFELVRMKSGSDQVVSNLCNSKIKMLLLKSKQFAMNNHAQPCTTKPNGLLLQTFKEEEDGG